MRPTVVGLVTPHLLRVAELADEAEKGVNVDWHLREAVAKTVGELREQYNASVLMAAYLEGLESAVSQVPAKRAAYIRVMRAAAEAVRILGRD